MPASRTRVWILVGLLMLPLAGLALLLAVPELDVRWEHHPSHFWLVLSVALVNMVLGLLTSEAASQRGDARLFLVSLALLSSAGFLGLHALATPGVLLEGPNAGFQIATPIGLVLAAVFAAASAWQRAGPRRAVHANAAVGARRVVRADRRVGDRLVREARGPASRPGRGGAADPPAARPGVGRAVRVRRRPVPGALPGAQADVAARGRRRVRPAGGGDDRGGVRAQLARHVVGVARVDGRRLRVDPVRRQGGVPTRALGGRHVRRALPGADARARRSPRLRGPGGLGRRDARRATARAGARTAPGAGLRRGRDRDARTVRARALTGGRAVPAIRRPAARGSAGGGAVVRAARRRGEGRDGALRGSGGVHELLGRADRRAR